MKSELGRLMKLNSQITTEVSNLTKALKGKMIGTRTAEN
jgi:DNA anti-recombination protein RmuC